MTFVVELLHERAIKSLPRDKKLNWSHLKIFSSKNPKTQKFNYAAKKEKSLVSWCKNLSMMLFVPFGLHRYTRVEVAARKFSNIKLIFLFLLFLLFEIMWAKEKFFSCWIHSGKISSRRHMRTVMMMLRDLEKSQIKSENN